MKRILIPLVCLLVPFLSHAQYITSQSTNALPGYKTAHSCYVGGLVVAGVSAAAWITGSAICVVEQNKYTNSHTKTGTIEEIVDLNNEAKQQPGYKTGQAIEAAGYIGMIAGGITAAIFHGKMKKIQNSAGKTVATIGYGSTYSGVGLMYRF
jgi:hypothetical protein